MPIQPGINGTSQLISVVGSQCASCISWACSPTITSRTPPNNTPVVTNIFR